ncbi:right-handed parallel beta-helix repeat-containing protein [Microvirga guangxiensis]|uniref:Parallel beta-helix repeat (Two copies) n=1 Tax=Microvirga guangxiensis TaxID=549386 RepID=A0A1G5I6V9_9HYPH|nr:right-handed parallel beta-helix repeat-containing protein [Microvirga guangxiensis]SCY71687.1 parallel beta-helix repeat (two copies) [Microvirga guangxiensis]
MIHLRTRLPIAMLATFLQAASVEAATIYVSTSGSDSNPGTIDQPLQTISKAAQVATPGTKVIVLGGVYRDVVQIPVGGTPGRPITFEPASGQLVVLDGSDTPSNTSLVQINASYINFRGFTVRNAKRSGITAWGTHHVNITNNKVHGSIRAGIWIGHTDAGQSYNNLIARNEIWDNCLENKSRTWESGWPQAIGLHASDRSIVQDNRVYRNYCEGIGTQSTQSVRVIGNTVSDSFSVNIYLDNAPGTIVRNNKIYHTNDSNFYRYGKPARGIQIANEYTNIELPSRGLHVSNNTLIGVGGITYGNYQRASGLIDSVISPNTILNTTEQRR